MQVFKIILVLYHISIPIKCYLLNNRHFFRKSSLSLTSQSQYFEPSAFKSEDTELVLKEIEKTDRGSESNPELDTKIKEWIKLKSYEYQSQNKTAKKDVNLFGNFDVSYVGSGKNQTGQPAGGAFRGYIGKQIFTTDKLLQNIIKNEKNQTQVINVVKGRLFTFIPFRVILYGIATFLTENERSSLYTKYGNNLTESAVRADFEPPLICFGNEWNKLSFSIRLGPKSNVVLDTPYVDFRVRLGVGSRGSLFIFTRSFDMMANEWVIWRTQRKPLSGEAIGKALLLFGFFLNFFVFEKIVFEILRIFNAFKSIVFLPGSIISLIGLFLITSRGGILKFNNELKIKES